MLMFIDGGHTPKSNIFESDNYQSAFGRITTGKSQCEAMLNAKFVLVTITKHPFTSHLTDVLGLFRPPQ